MSKFLNLLSKYNHILNEADQVSPEVETDPTIAEIPETPEAEAQQVSPDEQSALPIVSNDDIRKFLQSFKGFVEKVYNGGDKEELINILSKTDDDQLLKTFETISQKINPAISSNPELTPSSDSNE